MVLVLKNLLASAGYVHHRALNSAPRANSGFSLVTYFIHSSNRYVNTNLSIHPTTPLTSLGIHTCVLYFCVGLLS